MKIISSLKKAVKRFVIYSPLVLNQQKYRLRKLWYFESPYNDRRLHSELSETVLEAVLKYKTGTFLDVGVNMGQTLMKLLKIDRHRDYIGFEPNVQCCFYVEEFMKTNHLDNHRILPVGLSNKSGVARLLINEGTTCTSSLVENFRPDSFYSYTQFIYTSSGDFILADLGLSSVSVIKIDVEGAELEVIEGFKESMAKYKPFILFEVLPHYLVITNESLDGKTIEFRENRIRQIEDIFKNEGYSVFLILSDNALKKIDRIEPDNGPDLSKTDYIAVPCCIEEEFLKLSGLNVS